MCTLSSSGHRIAFASACHTQKALPTTTDAPGHSTTAGVPVTASLQAGTSGDGRCKYDSAGFAARSHPSQALLRLLAQAHLMLYKCCISRTVSRTWMATSGDVRRQTSMRRDAPGWPSDAMQPEASRMMPLLGSDCSTCV